jgi:hypothetical protein
MHTQNGSWHIAVISVEKCDSPGPQKGQKSASHRIASHRIGRKLVMVRGME